jgi:hypothetical protein
VNNVKWRPISTAPKNEQILLSYIGGDGETAYVNQGRWVQWLHENQVTERLKAGLRTLPASVDGHWEIAYIAVMQHGGASDGLGWTDRSFRVEPTHWMPLPKPCKKTKP